MLNETAERIATALERIAHDLSRLANHPMLADTRAAPDVGQIHPSGAGRVTIAQAAQAAQARQS